MPIKQLTAAAALVFVLLASAPLEAATAQTSVDRTVIARVSSPLLSPLALFSPAPSLAQSVIPDTTSLTTGADTVAGQTVADDSQEEAAVAAASADVTDLRKSLLAVAMKLRDTRYVRGGRDPATGFDCSGFVRYVFSHAVGLQLPRNSAAQFLAGFKVQRADMQPGDLVFFRTHGKHRISHVGIYISNGRFIHSPSAGKSVEISSLSEGYWAKRFAGAKRPEAMTQIANKG